MEEEYIRFGKIVNTHGIKGELSIFGVEKPPHYEEIAFYSYSRRPGAERPDGLCAGSR